MEKIRTEGASDLAPHGSHADVQQLELTLNLADHVEGDASVTRCGLDVAMTKQVRDQPSTVDEEEQFMRNLDAWISRADPTREETAKAIDLGRVPRLD